VGALEGSEPKTGYDVIFEMDLAYYTKELMWVQSVTTEAATIELLIEYQACDDALCIFREEPLTIPQMAPWSMRLNVTLLMCNLAGIT
jgi:hypothetical protein